jgi:hypothetical protein
MPSSTDVTLSFHFELAATLSSLQGAHLARLLIAFSTSALPFYASWRCHFMIQGTKAGI